MFEVRFSSILIFVLCAYVFVQSDLHLVAQDTCMNVHLFTDTGNSAYVVRGDGPSLLSITKCLLLNTVQIFYLSVHDLKKTFTVKYIFKSLSLMYLSGLLRSTLMNLSAFFIKVSPQKMNNSVLP